MVDCSWQQVKSWARRRLLDLQVDRDKDKRSSREGKQGARLECWVEWYEDTELDD